MHSSRMRTMRNHVYPSMYWVGGVCPGGMSAQGVGCLPRDVYPSMHWGRHPPSQWTEFLTHACENNETDEENSGQPHPY